MPVFGIIFFVMCLYYQQFSGGTQTTVKEILYW